MCCSYHLLIHYTGVNGQNCTNSVGSLSHGNTLVPIQQTFILAGYIVLCNGTVVALLAWEFCYRSTGASVTFYPGIWSITGAMNDTTDYELVQSNSVTYDASIQTGGIDHNK